MSEEQSSSPQSNHKNFVVKIFDTIGKAAVAARSFDVGELVLVDPVLFHITRDDEEEDTEFLNSLHVKHHLGAGLLNPLICFRKASATVRQKLLTTMHVPPLDRADPCQNPFFAAAADVVKHPLYTQYSEDDIVSFLLVLQLNQHALLVGGSAIFEFGSKITHSCNPNLIYRPDGLTCRYFALKPIAKGELLTFSYTPADCCWSSTPVRRARLLAERYFECACSACCSPDLARAMRCRKCNQPNVIHKFGNDLRKVNKKKAQTPAALSQLQKPWVCSDCKATYGDAEMPIPDECQLELRYAEVSSSVVDQSDISRDQIANLMSDLLFLRDNASRILGPKHWLCFGFLERAICMATCFMYSEVARLGVHHREVLLPEVVSWHERLLRWMAEVVPGSVAEANAARNYGALMAVTGFIPEMIAGYSKALRVTMLLNGEDGENYKTMLDVLQQYPPVETLPLEVVERVGGLPGRELPKSSVKEADDTDWNELHEYMEERLLDRQSKEKVQKQREAAAKPTGSQKKSRRNGKP